MRVNHTTIREVASRMGVTMKSVRKWRNAAVVPFLIMLDYWNGITGEKRLSDLILDAWNQYREIKEIG